MLTKTTDILVVTSDKSVDDRTGSASVGHKNTVRSQDSDVVVLILFRDCSERLHGHGMVQLGEADDGTSSLRSIQSRQQELHGSLVAGPSERSRSTHVMASAIDKHLSRLG